jgi:hypothetical protein
VLREDLAESSPLREGRRSYEFVWYRWESGYKLVERDGKEPYFEAVPADYDNIDWYYPLISAPHLFLDFARLQEQKDVDEAIRAWISDYGLLGLHACEPTVFREGAPSMMYFVGEHSTDGGPGETLAKVRTEVGVANEVLTLYEATLSKDTAKLEQAFEAEGDSTEARRRRGQLRSLAKQRGIVYVDCLVHYTLERVFWHVQQVLEAFAHPCLVHHSPSTRPPIEHVWTPETMKSSLWPRNLLGAMYLQFLWLVDSAGELARCKHCDRIISYAPPRPGSGDRKPRKDKEFCDSRCRQNYHYHNRVKVRRRGAHL